MRIWSPLITSDIGDGRAYATRQHSQAQACPRASISTELPSRSCFVSFTRLGSSAFFTLR